MATRPFLPRNLSDQSEGICPDHVQNEGSAGVGREIAALLILAAATFLLLSLATFRRSYSDPSVQGADWVGPVGATLAGWLVQGFGVIAWLLPLELGLIGYPLFRGKRIGTAGLRIAGDLIVAIVAASLVQVLWPDELAFGAMPASGNVGLLFGELMRGMFSTIGSLLVGTTIIGLVLLGRSAFSFIELCEKTAATALRLLQALKGLFRRVWAAWFEARRIRLSTPATEITDAPVVSTRMSESAIIAVLSSDDEDDWIPFEKTGTPPIAVAESLRNRLNVTVGLPNGVEAHGTTVVSRREEPAIVSRREEPAIVSRREEPAIVSRREEPAIVSRREGPAIVSRREEPAIV